jgi:hypothetical protein
VKRNVISRPEMLTATLNLGGATIELADYAATGLLALAIGPRGKGKTNAGQVIAEQLSEQGWISVLIDPEGELESMYGAAVASPEALAVLLESRTQPIVVVDAKTTYDFLPYGEVISQAADQFRKPIFVMIDEGQVFSQNKHRKDGIGEAAVGVSVLWICSSRRTAIPARSTDRSSITRISLWWAVRKILRFGLRWLPSSVRARLSTVISTLCRPVSFSV